MLFMGLFFGRGGACVTFGFLLRGLRQIYFLDFYKIILVFCGVRWGSVIDFGICLREEGFIDKMFIFVYYSLIFW